MQWSITKDNCNGAHIEFLTNIMARYLYINTLHIDEFSTNGLIMCVLFMCQYVLMYYL
jgi:hypothetical protein